MKPPALLLEQFSGEKFNEIEITTSEDFVESFEEWAQNRSLNELFLIWLVLKNWKMIL